jgi:hypothetical protein
VLRLADLDAPGAPQWSEQRTVRSAEVEACVRRLGVYRHPKAENRNHPLYRAAAERWLESLAAQDITRLDARLQHGFVYEQVPALSGSRSLAVWGASRDVIDLLSVTREGRLAVIELKAEEDLQLALQAADYWLRVRWHQEQGDFQRFGYFPGLNLLPDPPLLFLVAPGLRFHPATDVVLRYLSSDVQVTRIGLNEDWRSGLKVVLRQ